MNPLTIGMNNDTIRLLDIIEETTSDGPGFRTSVYAAGCEHACPGCHNPQSWDMNGGQAVEIDRIARKLLADPWADVTFTGGDPMYQAEAFAQLARLIRQSSDKTIWCYTGFTYEALLHHDAAMQLLCETDVLVDGPFIQHLRTTDIPFRGSSNQRIIDVKASLATCKTVLYDLRLAMT